MYSHHSPSNIRRRDDVFPDILRCVLIDKHLPRLADLGFFVDIEAELFRKLGGGFFRNCCGRRGWGQRLISAGRLEGDSSEGIFSSDQGWGRKLISYHDYYYYWGFFL